MPLFASRRKATQGSCPWCSLALLAIAGFVLRGELTSGVSAGAPATRVGSLLATDELRAVLGAGEPAAPAAPTREPESPPPGPEADIVLERPAPPVRASQETSSPPEVRPAPELERVTVEVAPRAE